MNETNEHMTVDPLMLHLRLPATWFEKVITSEGTLEIEKILFLVLAMLDSGMTTYELQQRLMNGLTND